MKDTLKSLVRRFPWRLLIAFLGGALVFNGGTHLLSIELPADSSVWTQAAKQGMGMVVAGGVVLIVALVVR